MAPVEQFDLPNPGASHTGPSPTASSRRASQWRSRLNLPGRSSKRRELRNSDNDAATTTTAGRVDSRRSGAPSRGTQPSTRSRAKIHFFRGMINDVKRRAPFYWSDWRDAWDYRVVPATVYMYFANILPALAFSLDMFAKTNSSFGVNETLLASVLGSVVFSLLAAQPLVIVGVTGPITVFNYTVYDIMAARTNYFAFMCWIALWSLVMHWILAITNACNGLKFVTRFSCDIFGFYVAFIYLQKGIQVLTRQWEDAGETAAYLSIAVALLVFMAAFLCGAVGESWLFHRHVRKFVEDYGTPLTVIFFTGFVHIGRMASVELPKLPTSRAFFPTQDRGWLIHFWDIDVADVFIAIPFAVLLTILFYFDHNVSSLIAQGTEFPLRKPAGFHWDIFLLGFTTGVAGLLGIPCPNGLIPQAPFHTAALCVHRSVSDTDEGGSHKGHTHREISHVVEQRVSNLAQGLLTLVIMTGPLLVVLALIPQAVLAGLFFVMGVQALLANGITAKLIFLLRDRSLTPRADPLARIERRTAIWLFVAIELVGFGATFAITQTIAAVGFPVFILLLIPARIWLLPRWFSAHELAILDAPTASPFTMESVGGNHGEVLQDPADEGQGSGGEELEVSGKEDAEGTASPTEDEAERGVAAGVLGQDVDDEAARSKRRRSFRAVQEGEQIELGGMSNRHGKRVS